MAKLQVYFDYGSPYAYLGWQRVTRIRPERYKHAEVEWIAASAGHLFKRDGSRSNVMMPNQKRHLVDDVGRWAEHYGIPFAPPADGTPGEMPVYSVDALRLHIAVADEGEKMERAWMEAVFMAYFRDGADISDRSVLDGLLDSVGSSVQAADADRPELKARLVANTDAAYLAGAPGVPFTVFEGAGYWGNDRLEWVEARLARRAPGGT
ncbi:MAG: DsbA family protein [Euryarchaeota archaeon]|nr:DsbA family protein [Euryarchaeota archaeon]